MLHRQHYLIVSGTASIEESRNFVLALLPQLIWPDRSLSPRLGKGLQTGNAATEPCAQ
ncbi:MAG: hypothetical protein JJE04_23665 [Acidobacteriia bacterium]|nr:hypothetical protein [Terriglobia bacterium]